MQEKALPPWYNAAMDVYVEYVILDNLALDILLLWAAAKTLRLPVRPWRILIGGAVGAACAVASAWTSGVWLFALKTVCLLAMCTAVVGFGKKLFWYILLTLAYTFVAGGAIYGLFFLSKDGYVHNGEFYGGQVPLFVYVLALAAMGFVCHSITVYVRQVKRVAPHVVKIVVKLNKSYNLTGFCDSGNGLCHNGVPVCFVTKSFGGFAEYFAAQALARKTVSVQVSTVAGKVSVQAVDATVSLGGAERKVYLALPAEKCRTMYNVLLNSEFCGGDI